MAAHLLSGKTDFGSSLALLAEVNIQEIWPKKQGLKIMPNLNTLVKKADLILSILPPEYAVEQAIHVAAAMKATEYLPRLC